MPSKLFYLPFRPAIDPNGLTVSGAELYFYAAGTTTPLPVYADEGLTVPLGQPVEANAAGKWPAIYLDPSLLYRALLRGPRGPEEGDLGEILDDADPYLASVADEITPELAGVVQEAQDAAAASATSAGTAAAQVPLAAAEVVKAEAWATGTAPGGVGSRSAREWSVAAALSSATAESAAGPTYPNTAAGLAATPSGHAFAVDNGNGTVTVYLNNAGVAVAQRTLLTTDYAASPLGAKAIGTADGGTVDNSVRWISPVGADRTGMVVSTATIQAGIDAATAAGKPFVMGEGDFLQDGPIYITCDFDGSNARFIYPPNYKGLGVVVASGKVIAPAMARMYRKEIILPEIIGGKVGAGWASVSGAIGAYAINCMECEITVRDVFNCETGFKLHGYDADCNYNKIYVNRLFQNRDNFVLHGQRVSSGGSCNQNTIEGGRYAFDTSEGSRVPGTNHIRLIAEGTAVSCNNNVFINPSLEGRVDENAIKGETIAGGSVEYNTIVSPRAESGGAAGKRFLFDGTNCRRNVILHGYGVGGEMVVENNGANLNMLQGTLGSIFRTQGPRPGMSLQTSGAAVPLISSFLSTATPQQMVDVANAFISLFASTLDFKNGANDATYRLSINATSGALRFADGTNPTDVNITRNRAGSLLCSGVMGATGGLAVGNSAPATTPGSVVRRIEVFNSATGNSIGFIPVYGAIT